MCQRCATDPSARAKHRNASTFKAGANKRRHLFTRAEQRRGHQAFQDRFYDLAAYADLQMLARKPLSADAQAQLAAYAGVYQKIRSYYRKQRMHSC